MNIVWLIMACGAISALQARPLVREKRFKELAVFGVLLMSGFGLAVLIILGINVPSPSKGIEAVVRSLTDLEFGFRQD